jgi:hypothetical protein
VAGCLGVGVVFPGLYPGAAASFLIYLEFIAIGGDADYAHCRLWI